MKVSSFVLTNALSATLLCMILLMPNAHARNLRQSERSLETDIESLYEHFDMETLQKGIKDTLLSTFGYEIPDDTEEDTIETGDAIEAEQASVPRAIADALLSELNLEDVDPTAIDRAVSVGFSLQQVQHLTSLAQTKIDSDGNSRKVEEDLKTFRELDFPRSSNDGEIIGLGKLAEMSDEQHIALSEAIASASNSPTNDIDPIAVENALEKGVFPTVMARVYLFYKFTGVRYDVIQFFLTNSDAATR